MDLETEEQGRPVFVILYTACINSGKIRLYISQNQEGGGGMFQILKIEGEQH